MTRAFWLLGRGEWWAAVLALWESGPQMVQLGLSLNAIGFGYILLDPTPIFPTAKTYDWMASHGTESQWGGIFLSVGMLGLCGVFGRTKSLKIVAALVTSLHAGLTGWTYYLSNPAGSGWFTYSILSGLAYWLLWHRIFRNA